MAGAYSRAGLGAKSKGGGGGGGGGETIFFPPRGWDQ